MARIGSAMLQRYKKKQTQAMKQLEIALAEKMKLMTKEQQEHAVKISEHPPITTVGVKYVETDLLNTVYSLYDKPFLRFRFTLRGTLLDFVLEDYDDSKRSKERSDARSSDRPSGLVGLDGRPIPRSE